MATLDLTPEPLTIIAKRAMTWEWAILWLDEQGTPIDNTGYDFYFTLKVAPADTTPVLTLSTSEGSLTESGSSGYVNFNVAASVTDIDTLSYAFLMWAEPVAGVKKPVGEGTLVVED